MRGGTESAVWWGGRELQSFNYSAPSRASEILLEACTKRGSDRTDVQSFLANVGGSPLPSLLKLANTTFSASTQQGRRVLHQHFAHRHILDAFPRF